MKTIMQQNDKNHDRTGNNRTFKGSPPALYFMNDQKESGKRDK